MSDSRITRNIGTQLVDEFTYTVGGLTVTERYDSQGRLISRRVK